MINTFISYEGLPISSGGAHALNRKSAKQNFEEIHQFLKAFTNTDDPVSTNLTYLPKGNTVQRIRAWARITSEFGIPSLDIWSPGRPWTWRVSKGKQENAFQCLESLIGLGENVGVLSFLWHFHFINPQTRETLAGQDGIPLMDVRNNNSQMYLRLGKSSTVSIWFAFPFSELTVTNRNYLEQLSKALPFRLSNKHWRIWEKTKNRNWKPSALDMGI